MYICHKLVKEIRRQIRYRRFCEYYSSIASQEEEEGEKCTFEIRDGGCLVWCFKRVLKLIDRPWKMYPLRFLFGLGFDTSSEVALLGIASLQTTKRTSIWLILNFPVFFLLV